MSISVASIVFNPFTHDSRVLKEAKSLVKAGYKPCVIAHGDKGLLEVDAVQGVEVRRFSYLDRKRTKSKVIKLIKYLQFVYLSVWYVKGFNILHCHDLNALPIAVLAKKLFNKEIKVVYDAHEYETHTNGLSERMRSVLYRIEKFCLCYVDEVITVSESIAQEYERLYKIEKPSVVLNTPAFHSVDASDLFRKAFELSSDQKIFLYQGALGRGRGIEGVIEAFSELDKQQVLVFMGYGALEEEVKKAASLHENIFFHPAVAPDVVLKYTSSADYGISMIEDSCLSYRYCLPNKVFEYLMVGLPVIVSDLPEMKKLVEDYGVGMVATDMKEAVLSIQSMDKEALRKNMQKVTQAYNWEVQEKVLLEVYETMLGCH